ncbi:helix-turn-helix domain-containing protein [Anaerocolumna chitinilytica]|uniref:HTH araC/xylS-type domain-containing protein n=1 Tax=Anaerocolumna chitinilytica TaxID=1727145 RepID=A0A7I8DP24_9FIRM|nr:helix-turn-helix domain-containing protein [Anaerocolumna chitinilytica]BCJ99074.1 hypothetical protein bsdcttw_21150 [Anaerocolumna chitinilytica]
MDYCRDLLEKEEYETFRCVPSKYKEQGLFQYVYWHLDSNQPIVTPVDTIVHIIYVTGGECIYNGLNVSKGHMFVSGMNNEPLTSWNIKNLSMFSIDMDYLLYYSLTGMTPAFFKEESKLLTEENPFYALGKELYHLPPAQWCNIAERYIGGLLLNISINTGQYEYVIQTARILSACRKMDWKNISGELPVSCRHLQRQFAAFFGVTPKEYFNIQRFYKAFSELDKNSLADTAVAAGYYDQSHMNHEFRRMTGFSPSQVSRLDVPTAMRHVRKKFETAYFQTF